MTELCSWVLLIALCFTNSSIAAVRIKIQGSSTVGPIVADAAEHFKKQKGWQVLVDTQGGSSGGISAVAEGLVQLGMSSKPISKKDKKKYPKTKFSVFPIGYDAVSLAVSQKIFDAGIKSLSRKQIQSIYEKKTTNWKQLGGPDAPIVFYNKEPGRGTWSVFAKYLYGSVEATPEVNHPEVGGNQEARSKVASHPSALTQLSVAWVGEGTRVRALGVEVNGKTIFPSLKTIGDASYPMKRSLILIAKGEPSLHAKQVIDFLRSENGKKLVRKHGFTPLDS